MNYIFKIGKIENVSSTTTVVLIYFISVQISVIGNKMSVSTRFSHVWSQIKQIGPLDRYEMVYLPLCKVSDTPFHIQGDDIRVIFTHLELCVAVATHKLKWMKI